MYAARKAVNLFIGMFIAIVNKISPCFVQYQTLWYCCCSLSASYLVQLEIQKIVFFRDRHWA